jgi:hypothetical protein
MQKALTIQRPSKPRFVDFYPIDGAVRDFSIPNFRAFLTWAGCGVSNAGKGRV